MIEQNNIPARNPVKMRYTWRDVERLARKYGLPFEPGLPYPVDKDGLANRVAMVGALEGWCAQYVQAVYRAWFGEKRMPGDLDLLRSVLEPLVSNADDVIARADSSEIRDQFAAATAAARTHGIFGAPSFVVDGELFWGHDRLDDALAWRAERAR